MEWYDDDRPKPSMEFGNPRFLLKAKNRRKREGKEKNEKKKVLGFYTGPIWRHLDVRKLRRVCVFLIRSSDLIVANPNPIHLGASHAPYVRPKSNLTWT